MEFLRVE